MKQRVKKLMAIALTAAMGISMMPMQSLTAEAAGAEMTFTEAQEVPVSHSGTERISVVNDNWKFYLGTSATAMENNFNDSSWENVNLPHDFSITQEFTTAGEAESGFLLGGTGWYRKKLTLPASAEGKTIVLNFDGVYAHATVYVNGQKLGENHYGYTPFSFDITDYVTCNGVTENVIAVEAVNNIPSSRWYSGSGIYRDVKLIVTDKVHVAMNGTYVTTPNLADSNGADGTVNVKVDVQNDQTSAASVTVKNTIYEKGGTTAVAENESAVTVEAGATETAEMTIALNNPKLWDLDAPNQYTVKTEILQGSKVLDTYETDYGYKWTQFIDNQGFKLNGKFVKINGVCMHHDMGALGSAAYYDAMKRQIQILKDMGVNTIRATHNPYDEDYIDICNELGIMVIEEAFDGWGLHKNGNTNDFSAYFTQNLTEDNQIIGGDSSMIWAEFALKSVMKRDRNDASILMWSLGNEIQEGCNTGYWEWGGYARKMIDWAAEVDTAHLLTSGSNNRNVSTSDSDSACVNKILYDNGGIPGFNYGDGGGMDSLHRTYPVFLYSETASATTSRGIYVGQASNTQVDGKMHLTSYDTSTVGWGKTAHDSMYIVYTRDYIAGQCVWTGFDYIGEPTPYNGTNRGSVSGRGAMPNSSYFGIVDTAGFPKDTYYLYRSQWNQNAEDPTLHLLTSWDEGNMMKDGSGKTPVWVYSNAPVVKLYLDGQQIGTATRNDVTSDVNGLTYYTYTTESNNSAVCTTTSGSGSTSLYSVFNVVFTPGTISARAFQADGVTEIKDTEGTKTISTPGSAANLNVSQDKTEITADGSSLAYISVDVTDADGNFDTKAVNDITFTLEGEGEIAGVDNGDQATLEKFQQPSVITSDKQAHIKAFSGKALVIVRSTKNAGNIKVTASADGLTGGTAEIKTVKATTGKKVISSYRLSEHCYAPVGLTTLALPATVSVSYEDGTQGNAAVTWNSYDKSNLNKPGTFTVSGTIPDGADKIAVSMTVHMYSPIATIKGYSGITKPGTMPTLPGTLMSYYADGSAFEEFPVVWNMAGLTESSFAKAGDIVKIKGTVNALGKVFEAEASIRVATPVAGTSANIAPQASKLTQSCTNTADTLEAVNDGIKQSSASGGEGTRWTNWNQRGDASITFAWDTAQMVHDVNVYYYLNGQGIGKAKGVTFEYSLDGTNFKTVGHGAETALPEAAGAVNGYSYALDEDVNPIAFRVNFEQDGNGTSAFIGVTEIELNGVSYTYNMNSSADPGKITVGGKEVTVTEGTVTKVDVESLADVKLSNENNAAVTIIPDGNGAITILTTSEDGSETKSIQIALTNPPSAASKDAAIQAAAVLQNLNANDYTPESYQALNKAVEDLENSIGLVSANKLNQLVAAVTAAKNGLVKKSVPVVNPPAPKPDPIVRGLTKKVGTITYKVVDVNKKTVTITKGANKKATKVNVPAMVNINGVKCKVVSIGKNAFKGYSKLKSVVIGKNVTTIESKAFYGCKKLSKVTFKGAAVKKIKSGAFKKTSSKMTVKVPKSLKKNKKAFNKFKKSLTKSGISKKAKIR